MAAGSERFALLGELGRGGMATVYLAQDTVRGTRVALKVLHPHLADEPDARDRLLREVRATSALRHPHIVAPHEVHDLDGRLALSMPLHRGRTLADAVAEDGPLDEAALTGLAAALSDALAVAHHSGVLHRDVTPSNVMLGGPDGVSLMDFGLARLSHQATATRTAALGTVGYAPPEIYDGVRAEPRSDLYGLGGVLYFAATGTAPWGAGAPMAVLKRQLDGQRAPLRTLRPDLDPVLADIIDRCLAPEPGDRPASARAVHVALSDGEHLPAPARTPTAPATRRGMYTLILSERHTDRRRRAAVRRFRGPLLEAPAAAPEKALLSELSALLGGAPLIPEDAMRRREFKLLEAVDRDTAEAAADLALAHGFVPRLADDPHVRWSRQASQLPLIGAMFALAGVSMSMTGAATGASWALVLATVFAVAMIGLILRFWSQIQLHPALPALDAARPKPVVEADSEVGRLGAQVAGQLRQLSAALDAHAATVPAVAASELRSLLGALEEQRARMQDSAARLYTLLDDEADQIARGRLAARHRRLKTLRAAGEAIDPAALAAVEGELASLSARAAERDAAEADYTRLLARLLEVGAAAGRATRQLDAGRGEDSVRDLLQRLGEHTRLARASADEVSNRAARAARLSALKT